MKITPRVAWANLGEVRNMPDRKKEDAPAPRQTDRWLEPGKTNAQIVYLLYLAGFAVGLTWLLGLVIAYVNRGKAEEWVNSHYVWAIRTFWIGLAASLVAGALMVIGVGFLLMFAVMVWVIVRCIIGLQKLGRDEAIDDPQTLWI